MASLTATLLSDGFAGDADAIEAHRRARRRGGVPSREVRRATRRAPRPGKRQGGALLARASAGETPPRRPPPTSTTPSPPRSGASSAATASSVSRPRPSPRRYVLPQVRPSRPPVARLRPLPAASFDADALLAASPSSQHLLRAQALLRGQGPQDALNFHRRHRRHRQRLPRPVRHRSAHPPPRRPTQRVRCSSPATSSPPRRVSGSP